VPKFKQKVLNLAEARVSYLGKITPIDEALKLLFLGMVPKSVTPNNITVFRFATIPFIVWFLCSEWYLAATILFIFSAFSDALDGALARTTNRITRWGILADPLADKLLVGSVGIILISRFLSWKLAALIVILEILIIASAYYRYRGKIVPAKLPGKIKMLLQCVGIILLFFYVLFGGGLWIFFSALSLSLSVVFALLSLLLYKSI